MDSESSGDPGEINLYLITVKIFLILYVVVTDIEVES